VTPALWFASAVGGRSCLGGCCQARPDPFRTTLDLTLFALLYSQAKRQRVSEDTLLALGFVGGWPGAIVAQQILRHKSNKASFRAKFWKTLIANVVSFVVLASPLRSMVLA
jgi:uncharacterized membrane protein YsdA (DUF1294 family)